LRYKAKFHYYYHHHGARVNVGWNVGWNVGCIDNWSLQQLVKINEGAFSRSELAAPNDNYSFLKPRFRVVGAKSRVQRGGVKVEAKSFRVS